MPTNRLKLEANGPIVQYGILVNIDSIQHKIVSLTFAQLCIFVPTLSFKQSLNASFRGFVCPISYGATTSGGCYPNNCVSQICRIWVDTMNFMKLRIFVTQFHPESGRINFRFNPKDIEYLVVIARRNLRFHFLSLGSEITIIPLNLKYGLEEALQSLPALGLDQQHKLMTCASSPERPTCDISASETTARATATAAGWSAARIMTMLMIWLAVCALTILAALADAAGSAATANSAGFATMPLTIKRQPRTTAAANGSNRIVLRRPRSSDIYVLTCLDDLY